MRDQFMKYFLWAFLVFSVCLTPVHAQTRAE